MGEPKTGGSSLDIAKMTQKLNPITALPEETSPQLLEDSTEAVQYPLDIENSLDVIRYTQANSNNRFQTPTVFATDYNQMPDVDWDIEDIQGIGARRAYQQSGWTQAGNAINQAIVGEIGGGMVMAVGSLTDVVGGLLNGRAPWESDFKNDLTEFGKSVIDWTKEYTPIYAANPGKSFDPSDSGWWASNGVSVASMFSLIFPGMAVAKGVSYAGKGARYLAGAGKASRSKMVSGISKKLQQAMTTSRAGDWLRNSIAMGVSMRHMENFREAGDTWDHSFQKNMDFLQDPKNLEDFINSEKGKSILKSLNITPKDPYLKSKVSNHVAGKAAANSYNLNWSNVGFDIMQSALWYGPMRVGTRPGRSMFGRHSTKVEKAHYATLKARAKSIYGPKTKVGKAFHYVKPIIPPALWAYSEGIEEQINFMSMQEGIRTGDVLMGNTGYTNREFQKDANWVNRVNEYYSRGELWTATVMGSIGGGIFTGAATLKNSKAQAALDNARVKEIGGRSEIIQKALEKRRVAIERGDLQGAAEQDQLMAIQLALTSAQAGNMDQLEQMLNDESFVDMLTEAGLSKEEIGTKKTELIDILRQTEKKYNMYSNRAKHSKWGTGVATALTQLDMSVTMYDKLIKNIDSQIENNLSEDIYNVEQYNTGPNTKSRHELQLKRRALQDQLKQFEQARDRAGEVAVDENVDKSEREESKALVTQFDTYIKKLEDLISLNEVEGSVLKKSSQESYEDSAYRTEEEFLDKVDKGSLVTLANKKQLFTWNRDAAWTRLQELLKEDMYYTDRTESNILKEISVVGKEKIAEEAENNAIIEDFKTEIQKNPNMSEQEVANFFEQYPENEQIQQFYQDFINEFRQAKELLIYMEMLKVLICLFLNYLMK